MYEAPQTSPTPAFREVLALSAEPRSRRYRFMTKLSIGFGLPAVDFLCPGVVLGVVLDCRGFVGCTIAGSSSCPGTPLDLHWSNRLVRPQRPIACQAGRHLEHAPAPRKGVAQRTLLCRPADLPRAAPWSRQLAWAFRSIPGCEPWVRFPVVMPSRDPQLRARRQVPWLDAGYPGIVKAGYVHHGTLRGHAPAAWNRDA